MSSYKTVTFGCLVDMGVAYKPYKTLHTLPPPLVNIFLVHALNPIHCLVLQMETFYQHRHDSLDNAKWIFKIFLFVIFLSTAMLGAI